MLRSLCCTAAAVLSVVVVINTGCAPPHTVKQPPQLLGTDPLPTGGGGEGEGAVAGEGEGGVGGEGEGEGGETNPTATPLAMSVTFREPGQHVILNVQAGDTVGQHPNTVADAPDVPQPFGLDDDATENALTASAHLDIDVDTSAVVVHGDASFSADQAAYAVGQAGPLPLTVCATGDAATVSRVKIELVCDGSLDVSGNGIAALTASSGSGAQTQSWCNWVNLDGDTSLIPFTVPTHVVQFIDATDGTACWDVDVYAGSNTGDHAGGAGSANGTFTFTATDATPTSP